MHLIPYLALGLATFAALAGLALLLARGAAE